ncbi:MAG: Smr/MutS family protein [Candidatus Marinimicrobia bacterium]|nr:Smr/MutS family protein [Candidatus Neomarinimicrobiota bacterium]
MPTVEEAMIRLERNLNFAKHEGVPLIRIIHGYGSSGVGGDIRVACHHYLQRALYQRKIKAFFPGESLSVTTPEGQNLLQRYPSLKKDKGNCGITLVELSF